jgi:hypothetical protein
MDLIAEVPRPGLSSRWTHSVVILVITRSILIGRSCQSTNIVHVHLLVVGCRTPQLVYTEHDHSCTEEINVVFLPPGLYLCFQNVVHVILIGNNAGCLATHVRR